MSVQKEGKVFCLGWHKTGTTTLGSALIRLGYKVVGARLDTVEDLQAGRIENVLDLAKGFDAFQDVPWAALYRELDIAFPGSKFIFVEREEDKWLKSATRHFNDLHIPMHEWLYGTGMLAGNEQQYLKRYRRHNADVKKYFQHRDDFLVFSLDRGDGWPELCRFLNRPMPRAPFPHENKRLSPLTARERVLKYVRHITPMPLRSVIFQMRLLVRKLRGLPDPRNRFHNFDENRRHRGKSGL